MTWTFLWRCQSCSVVIARDGYGRPERDCPACQSKHRNGGERWVRLGEVE